MAVAFFLVLLGLVVAASFLFGEGMAASGCLWVLPGIHNQRALQRSDWWDIIASRVALLAAARAIVTSRGKARGLTDWLTGSQVCQMAFLEASRGISSALMPFYWCRIHNVWLSMMCGVDAQHTSQTTLVPDASCFRWPRRAVSKPRVFKYTGRASIKLVSRGFWSWLGDDFTRKITAILLDVRFQEELCMTWL